MNISKSDVLVIVNSSDGFEDCWDPFFYLFKTFWPNCKYPILLNTEFKDYRYPGLPVAASKVNAPFKRKLTWSECLIEALNKVDSPLILYLQEDYFIEQPVLGLVIEDFSKLMLTTPDIKYIGLTHFGNCGTFDDYSPDNRLKMVRKNSKYRISTQAALWRRETLLSYLRPDENGWMFEIFGTQRAKKKDDLFLTANRACYFEKTSIIRYEHTGIIKGKWHHKIPALFNSHQIKMDFPARGIYRQKPWILRKIETAKKLAKNPVRFLKGMLGI